MNDASVRLLAGLIDLPPNHLEDVFIDLLKLRPDLSRSPRLLRSMFGPSKGADVLEEITRLTCLVRRVTIAELFNKKRTQRLSESRWIIWSLAFEYGGYNNSEIARRFQVDHHAVLNGKQRAIELMEINDSRFTIDYHAVELEFNRSRTKMWLDSKRPAVAIARAA